jgi:ubiquitin-protein ligase
MHESPRIRRLRNDLAALERLKGESSVLRFRGRGNPVQQYLIEFHGKSLARDRGKVLVRERHEVEIKLGASYPRTMPEIRWLTPIYHPNISEIGMVCLGGYGTHWVPSLNLDELCGMLWDMARFHNYDIRSPYNREAALWVANQATFHFPIDSRPLRDLRAALGRVAVEPPAPKSEPAASPAATTGMPKDLGRYQEFVRKFAASLHTGAASIRDDAVHADPDSDGLILLDMEVELVPLPAPPRSGPNEEIVFIE